MNEVIARANQASVEEIENFKKANNIKQLSPQQYTLLQWVIKGSESARMIAVAGSGKTTTLVLASQFMQGSVCIAAYNKSIAAELKERVPARVNAATFHSLGLRLLGQIGITFKNTEKKSGAKFQLIADKLGIKQELYSFVRALVSLAKQSAVGFLTEFADLSVYRELVSRHNLDLKLHGKKQDSKPRDLEALVNEGISLAAKALEMSCEMLDIIDFDDMIYLPLILNIVPLQQYDWFLVDECQDLNSSRRALAKKLLKTGGRLIAVGDPHQAIYGFTGADADSFDLIKSEFNCVDIPLTVSWRCAKAVVRKAQQFVSHIQAADTAPEGIDEYIRQEELTGMSLNDADAILCRNVKPLVELLYWLLKNRIPAHIAGKAELGEELIKLATRWKSVKTLSALRTKLEDFKVKQVDKLMSQGREMTAEYISDQIEALFTIMSNLPGGSNSIEALSAEITSIFQEGKTVKLSTIHRSKGLEWKRVFWLYPNKYQPSRYARQAWQQEQEKNLMYVAATRAKSELYTII